MSTPRTATGLTIALLALPATAIAQSPPSSGGGESTPTLSDKYGWGEGGSTSTTPQDLRSPDAADAARAGDIAKAMEHYQRSQPAIAAAQPAGASDDTPAWPEIAFAGVVLLATAGGIVRVRLRRSRRVVA